MNAHIKNTAQFCAGVIFRLAVLVAFACPFAQAETKVPSTQKQTGQTFSHSSKVYHLSIKQQNLQNAIIKLASIAGLTFALPSDLLTNYRSQEVDGNFTVTEALSLMLANTDLYAVFTPNGVLKIKQKQAEEIVKEDERKEQKIVIEEVLVTGVHSAIQLSTQIKKNAVEIIEVITEEDIGKMPDNNIADALQRIPGVQMERRNGIGSVVRVRGFDQNKVLLNGQEFLTGMELFQSNSKNFEGSFESIPIDLLSRVEVFKTPSASQMEGSIGGTLDLISRSGFDIQDDLFIAEASAIRGKHSQENTPAAMLIFGKNWEDRIALMSAFSYRDSHNIIDSTNIYTDDGAFILPIYDAQIFAEGVDATGIPILFPTQSDVTSTRQERKNFGSDINLEFRFSENQSLGFQWFYLFTDIEEQYQSIAHDFLLLRDAAQNVEIDRHEHLATMRSGDFSVSRGPIHSQAETNDIEANNFTLKHVIDLSDKLSWQSYLQYLNAEATNRTGEINSSIGQVAASRWTGLDPDLPVADTDNLVGWMATTINPADGDPIREFTYRNNNGPRFSYTNPQWLNDSDYGAFSNHLAYGYNNQQMVTSLRSDIEWRPASNNMTTLKAGFRIQDKQIEYTQLRYLHDYSQTKNAAYPNQFNRSGEQIISSNFDPEDEPDSEERNIGIQLPVFYDLCGNGGLATGASCSIDSDDIDDNQNFGPYGYETGNYLWGELLDVSTSDGSNLLELLYGNRFNETRNLPNYSPSLSWNEAPHLLRQYQNFFPSGDYQHNVLLPDLDPLTRNVEQWIDGITPFTPGSMRVSPLESWDIEQRTSSVYVEADFASTNHSVSVNTGLRLVHTQTIIATNVLPDSVYGIRITPEGTYTGIPLFYETQKTRQDDFEFLPSINSVFNLDEQWKLRVSFSKNIAQPRLQDLGRGYAPENWHIDAATSTTAETGNPFLQPYKVSQFDLSLEKYWDKANYMALATFIKDIDSYIYYQSSFLQSDNDTVAIAVEMPVNADGGRVKGIELSFQSLWQAGFGIHVNYTFVDSETSSASLSHEALPLPGISENTLNVIAMYESTYFNARLAYNYRDEYLSPFNATNEYLNLETGSQYTLAQFVEASSQLDARLTWLINDSLSLSSDFYNLTNEPFTSYLEYSSNTFLQQKSEPAIELSIKYKLN